MSDNILQSLRLEIENGKTELVIPDGITRIPHSFFEKCTTLESAILPNSVEEICSSAFYGCSKLKHVKLPSRLERINSWSFKGCVSLQEVEIPETVRVIDNYAFEGCTSLREIHIPKSVEVINAAFADCTNIENVYLHGCHVNVNRTNGAVSFAKKNLKVHFDNIEQWMKCQLSGCLSFDAIVNGEVVKDLVIPSSIDSYHYHSTKGCTSLNSITFPNSIKTIHDGIGVDGISIRVNAENIEQWCNIYKDDANFFTVSYDLYIDGEKQTDITIPNNISSILRSAFMGCNTIECVTIEEGVTEIDYAAFNSCITLQYVSIPQSVKTIDSNAFGSCRKLNKVELPKKFLSTSRANIERLKSIFGENSPFFQSLCLDKTIKENLKEDKLKDQISCNWENKLRDVLREKNQKVDLSIKAQKTQIKLKLVPFDTELILPLSSIENEIEKIVGLYASYLKNKTIVDKEIVSSFPSKRDVQIHIHKDIMYVTIRSIYYQVKVNLSLDISAQEAALLQEINRLKEYIKDWREPVDMGVSVKWAKCDLGSNVPSKDGVKYWWGVASPAEKANLELYSKALNCVEEWKSETKMGKDTDPLKEYVGKKATKSISCTEKDAAHVVLGDGWRMPSRDELQELLDNCTCVYDEFLKGSFFHSKKNGNSLFIRDCWSYTPAEKPSEAFVLRYVSGSFSFKVMPWHRYYCEAIRPVKE